MPKMPTVPMPKLFPGSPSTTIEDDEDIDISDPWGVILWNDDVTPIQAVILALTVVVKLAPTKARDAANYIHEKGKAFVASGPKEEVERIAEELRSFTIPGWPVKLTVSVEPFQ